jgi:hypothetical protein
VERFLVAMGSLDPVRDESGLRHTPANAGIGQSGPVFFLGGTTGTSEARTITIPTGKKLCFPIANYLNDYPCPDPNFQPAPGQSL